MDHVAYFGLGLRRERPYVLRQAPQLLVGEELLIDQVAVALAAPDRVVELPPHSDGFVGRPIARRARELQWYDVLARVREERRKRLDVRHHVAPFGVREPRLPSGHRAPGKPLVDRPQQVRVGWELAARRRADLVQPAGEVARPREHVRRRRAVAGPAIAVTARAPLHVDRFPGRRVLGGEKHRQREHGSPDHFAPPFSVFSHVRGFHPVCSYRNRITDQISRSVRKSSHTGIAEFHGAPSRGSPGPPFATRQNTKLSVSWAIVPLSWKFAGSGLNPTAKCPCPSRWSPWHGRQFW